MSSVRFKVKGEYVIGSLRIPTDYGAVNVATVGGSKADALMRAATIAKRISEDPVMSAIMPPQAHAAIAASKALSVAAKEGPGALKKLWRRMKGPGKKRLAEALAEEARKSQVSGTRYQTSYRGVKLTNRGAWQEWQDPYHDAEDGYENAEAYDEDYSDIELGRRKRRRKGKGRRRRERERERERYEDDAIDEESEAEAQAPIDEPPVDEPPPDNEGA